MPTQQRRQQLEAAQAGVFDVAVVGGGVKGASIFQHLCSAGYRSILIEKNDFGSGTSQASAMMIWGGLLYLLRLHLWTVYRLCSSRDRLIAASCDAVQVRDVRYVQPRFMPAVGAYAGLHVYWLLGGCRRRRPRWERGFSGHECLQAGGTPRALLYQEGFVEASDSRFVLQCILPQLKYDLPALNYCYPSGGAYDASTGLWHLELADSLSKKHLAVRAKCVVNACGVWTDRLNAQFGIESPWRHALSKGVFLGLKRLPEHDTALIFDTHAGEDCLSLLPWGPISLWGPTETFVHDIEEGFRARPTDVNFLLEELNRHLRRPIGRDDIVSLRCGLRPLAVRKNDGHPADSKQLSRHYRLWFDPYKPWLSLHGGNLTNCIAVAQAAVRAIGKRTPPSGRTRLQRMEERVVEQSSFPGLDHAVPAPRWCVENEMCFLLEDYLRRRTNISQWLARGGLGPADENAVSIKAIAQVLPPGIQNAATQVAAYRKRMACEFDDVLARC